MFLTHEHPKVRKNPFVIQESVIIWILTKVNESNLGVFTKGFYISAVQLGADKNQKTMKTCYSGLKLQTEREIGWFELLI